MAENWEAILLVTYVKFDFRSEVNIALLDIPSLSSQSEHSKNAVYF